MQSGFATANTIPLRTSQSPQLGSILVESDDTHGQMRMTPELHGRGLCVNHKRVERLMRKHGIVGVHKPAKVRITIPAEDTPPMPDLIGRRFDPGEPDVAWVGDITYIPTGEGWLYLASVLDLGSRRWLGYSMAGHMRTELVSDALEMAGAPGDLISDLSVSSFIHPAGRPINTSTIKVLRPPVDSGQYVSHDYRNQVTGHSMVRSVGRTEVCWDNRVAESAWSSLKCELLHRYRFATRAEARRAIVAWINRYNSRRRHSDLGYIAPIAWEQQYHQPKANPAAQPT